MHSFGVVIAAPVRVHRGSFAAVGLALALLLASALAAATPTRAASPEPLKAVFIVGPAGSQTAPDLADAEELATLAESYGMDVRRVFFPHATWDNVMANVQGANLVYYAGHGYGWPSPYTKTMTESRQNGVGLNTTDGSNSNTYTYYGGNVIRDNWVLAPNAVVFLNHDCYTAGNGEPGMAIPTTDVARQRVDNFASTFLAVGARTVFALSYQRFNKVLTQLATVPDKSMEDLFRIPGAKPTPEWGWVGTNPQKFDSVRTPGTKNFLDPHSSQGFLRAVSGDLTMTGNEWKNGQGSGQAPHLSNFDAQTPGSNGFAPSDPAFFTPNGDGVTDTVALKFTVDRESFVDMVVRNQAGNVVKTVKGWSPGGNGSATWNGKDSGGSFVPDGTYSVTATPHNRAGEEGNTQSTDVNVFTTMKSPNVSPTHFYPQDGDSMSRTTTFSVNLQSQATFWWKVADQNGNVVRTFVNGSTASGPQSVQWDGKDNSGNYVTDGTYYSVTTTQTSAGTYFHSLPVEVRAFRLTTENAMPFKRGFKAKFSVFSAETLTGKPKVKVTVPGLAPKTYTAAKKAGVWTVTVNFPTTGQAGQVLIRVQATDTGAQFQYSDFSFPLQ
jgi:flagellar hook assembly protein FlgD